MSLTYNGADVKEIVYNGTALNQMDYNGVTVFKKDDDEEYRDKPYVSFIDEDRQPFQLWWAYDHADGSEYKTTAKHWNGTIQYSTDGEIWANYTGETIDSSSDGKLFLRGSSNTYLTYPVGTSTSGTSVIIHIPQIRLTPNHRIKVLGNIENLLDYKTVANGSHPTMASPNYSYMAFGQSQSFISGCYYYMFRGCTSLTVAPELPATTLANKCYRSMFSDCTSLTQAPELPATTLTKNCYDNMFYGCTSLTQAPELPATTLATYCYYYMFRGCTSLTQAPELPATTLAGNCYSSMFYGCTSLTQAPELPATTLAGNCYSSMFRGCTSLTGQIHLPASVASNSNRLKDTDISGSSATIVFDL